MRILSKYIIIILSTSLALSIDNSDIYDTSWALIIGINKYENVQPLSYAIDDAIAVKNLLINDFGFPRNNVNLLLNQEATQNNIKKQLDILVKSAKKNDRVLFYFAGHGETEPLALDGTDMGFLLPVEGDTENLYLTSIPMDELKRISLYSKAKHMLFLVDACYGGLAAQNTRGIQISDEPGFIDKISNEISRQIITAGGKDEEVIEKDDWQHSAFTKSLLTGLKEKRADLNSDGIITGTEVGMFLQEHVYLDTDNFQTPQVKRFTSHGGEIIFIPQNKGKYSKKDSESFSVEDLQAVLFKMYQKNQSPQTKQIVIKPGSVGVNAKNVEQVVMIESIFLRPQGLAYKAKTKMKIGASDEMSWSRTFIINIEDVLEIPGETLTGIYNYNTGEVE